MLVLCFSIVLVVWNSRILGGELVFEFPSDLSF